MTVDGLTHLDDTGNARMVDVSEKADTKRTAIAESFISMKPETLTAITQGTIKKGDVFAAARIAGIMAAKKTSDLIPLCHPLALTKVEVTCDPVFGEGAAAPAAVANDAENQPANQAATCSPCGVHIQATASLVGKTGVEMEALTAASVAALTVYDMCKAIDRGMEISDLRLLHKEGGKTGTWNRG